MLRSLGNDLLLVYAQVWVGASVQHREGAKMKPIVLTGILVLVLGLIFLIINQSAMNTYNGWSFSKSKQESITDDVYVGDLHPDKTHIFANGKKVIAVKGWSELSWKPRPYLFFWSRKQVTPGIINIIISDTSVLNDNGYMYIPQNGTILTNQKKIGYVFQFPISTLGYKCYIQQPSAEGGWVDATVTDSITYYVYQH